MNQDITIILTALAIYGAGTISPGPSFTLIVRLAASGARPKAFGATLGFSVGATIYAALAMTGYALIISRVGWLLSTIQVVGGCYLIYLGVTSWLAKPDTAPKNPDIAKSGGFMRGARTGLLVELTNPKSMAFFISIFAVAIPSNAATWTKLIILAGGFLLDIVWYGAASSLLSSKPVQALYRKGGIWIERVLGAVIAGFGLRIISDKI